MFFRRSVQRRILTGLHKSITLLSSASIIVSSVTQASAQTIIVDPSAPGISFLQTSNGTPQIDIATPQNGVSVNSFSDLNVNEQGLVLNNSTTSGVSVIGQNVTANPNLMVSGPANTIVNEVTGAAPSSFTGVTEVFGQSAAVIFANPNGITCNGCSFINSTASVLTTGTPTVANGQVDLDVQEGTITIGPDGLDVGQQGLIAGRHVSVSGPIVASGSGATNDLVISGGSHRVTGIDINDLSQSTIANFISTQAKTSPFAVDINDAGSIQVGDLTVLSFEANQGVNLLGDVSTRSLKAQSDGGLFYKDIDVAHSAEVNGGDVRQYGDATVGTNLWVTADTFTLYDGRTITTDHSPDPTEETTGLVSISASDFVVVAGEVSSRDIFIDVSNGFLSNSGFLLADGDLTVLAGDYVSQQREIASEYDVVTNPALQQYLQAYYNQLVQGGPEADIAAEMIARAGETEAINEYINRGASLSGTDIYVSTDTGDITNTGGAISATRYLDLWAGGNVVNEAVALQQQLTQADGCDGLNCGQKTEFHGGEVLAGDSIYISAGANVENRGGSIAAADFVHLEAGQDVVNSMAHSTFSNEETYYAGNAAPNKPIYRLEHISGNVVQQGLFSTLYGDLDVYAARDFVSNGSTQSAGNDLSIEAGRDILVTSFSDVERHSLYNYDWESYQYEQGDNEYRTGWRPKEYYTKNELKHVAWTSDFMGRSVSLASEIDISLSGARVLASESLDINARTGSLTVNAEALPDTANGQFVETFVNSGQTETVDTGGGLTSISADAGLALEEATGSRLQAALPELGEGQAPFSFEDYAAYLQDNEVLTAVEALRRASSGAEIKDAVRRVGTQSYISLGATTYLETLKATAQSDIENLQATLDQELATHDAAVIGNHDAYREKVAGLTAALNATDTERDAATQAALAAENQVYQSDSADVETAYQAALDASQAKYGHRLTTTRRVRKQNSRGDYYWRTYVVQNHHYINLKNASDAESLSVRNTALAALETEYLIQVASIQAAGSEEGISERLTLLQAQYDADMGSTASVKTALLETFNAEVETANRTLQLLTHQQALFDQSGRVAAAAGSVVKGSNSLAASLTEQAFPELGLLTNVGTHGDGLISNARDGTQERTRFSQNTRDAGELRPVPTLVEVPTTTYQCTYRGPEADPDCGNVTTYSWQMRNVTTWVATGTETYIDTEIYTDGTASNDAIFAANKADQDAFLNATVWRSATADSWVKADDAPKNRILSLGDVNLLAANTAELGDGTFDAADRFSISSLGTVDIQNANVSADTINVVAGTDLVGLGVSLNADTDVTLFAGNSVSLSSLTHEYIVGAEPQTVVGTLSAQDWGLQTGQQLASQQLSTIDAGRDLSVVATSGNVLVAGTDAIIGRDARLSAGADLGLLSSKSAIEFEIGNTSNGTSLYELRSHIAAIEAGRDIDLKAGGSATLEGSRLTAQGTISVAAVDDLILAAAQNVYEFERRTYKRNIFSKKTTYESKIVVENLGTEIQSEGDISLTADQGNLTTAGSKFEATSGNVNLTANTGDILAGAYVDTNRSEYYYNKSSFFGLLKTTRSTLSENEVATGTAALAGVDLNLVSAGDTELVGAQLAAGNDLNITTGGDLRILAAINDERSDFFENKLGAVLATTVTENSHKETAVLTTMTAGGDLNFIVDGETQLTLYSYENAAAPSVADIYPDELLALSGLVLLDDQLIDEYFFDETKTLSPAFVTVLTIALTMGYGNLLTGLDHAVSGLTRLTPATATAPAHFTLTPAGQATASFAASSTIGSVNGAVSGEFDLGDILRDAAYSAATSFLAGSIDLKARGQLAQAGEDAARSQDALRGANSVQNIFASKPTPYYVLGDTPWGGKLQSSVFGSNLTAANVLEGAFDSAVSTGVTSAVYGTDLKEGLKNGLVSSIVSLGLADAQAEIGTIFQGGANGGEGSFGHVILHGLAGCAAAELRGADCGAGAVGGVSQAIYAGALEAPDPAMFTSDADYFNAVSDWKADVTTVAESIGLAVGFFASGGDAANVSATNAVFQSGFQNNYLTHTEAADLTARVEYCQETSECDPYDVINDYRDLSRQNDIDLIVECGRDLSCIQDRLSNVANSSDIEKLAVYGPGIIDAVRTFALPGQEVSEHHRAILDGRASVVPDEVTYCDGQVDDACRARLQEVYSQRAALSTAVAGGSFAVVRGVVILAPRVATLCAASPTCSAAYASFETAGNATDLVSCAAGDLVACAGAAVNAITPGNFTDELIDVTRATNTGLGSNSYVELPPRSIGSQADNFTGGTYQTVRTTEETVIYRSFGGDARLQGGYATPTQGASRSDLAIEPDWGNSMRFEATVTVPRGTTLNVGTAGPQATLPGGGSQILMPRGWNGIPVNNNTVRITDTSTGRTYSYNEFATEFPDLTR